MLLILLALLPLGLVACGGDEIDSDEEARRAYFGLDGSIAKSLTLGFAGFNAATSANIPPQMATGDTAGMLTITGQVDQGSSANKGMRLRVGMVGYSDGPLVIGGETIDVDIVYDTVMDVAMQPYLELQLRNIPTGTFSGTLTGIYTMSGDLKGEANVSLSFSGNIQADAAGKVIRAPGTTTITGTAASGDGVFEVSITL